MGCSPSGTDCCSMGPFPRGAVLQEQVAPVRVPHRVTSPASSPAPAWAPLSMGPEVLPGACCSTGSPRGDSLLQPSTCSSVGSSIGCRWISAPLWTSSPSFFTDLGICRVVSFTYPHSSILLQFFPPA